MGQVKEQCCLCLNCDDHKNFADLFSSTDGGITHFEKISLSLYQIRNTLTKYADNDYKICLECSEKIDMIYHFNLDCLRNMITFLSEKDLFKNEHNLYLDKNKDFLNTDIDKELIISERNWEAKMTLKNMDIERPSLAFEPQSPKLSAKVHDTEITQNNIETKTDLIKYEEFLISDYSTENLDQLIKSVIENVQETFGSIVENELPTHEIYNVEMAEETKSAILDSTTECQKYENDRNLVAKEDPVEKSIFTDSVSATMEDSSQQDLVVKNVSKSRESQSLSTKKLKQKTNILKRLHAMRPVCECCANKCTKNISEDLRTKIHHRYWSLNFQSRKKFIRNHIKIRNFLSDTYSKEILPFKRNNKRTSIQFYFYKSKDESVKVCKSFFLATLGYKYRQYPFLYESFEEPKLPCEDFGDDQDIKKHIDSFVIKKDSGEQKISTYFTNMSCSELYKDFKKKYLESHCIFDDYYKVYIEYIDTLFENM